MNSSINSHQCCPPEKAQVIVVQNVAGIQQFANSFVRVLGNNSVYYVDRAHNVTLISSQVVEVRDYNAGTNPLNLRNQIAYDVSSEELTYFTNAGIGVALSSAVQLSDLQALDDKLSAQMRDVTAEVNALSTEVTSNTTQVADLTSELFNVNEKITSLTSALATETANREEEDSALNSSLETVTNTVTSLGNITVQTDTAVSGDASTVTISKTRGELNGSQIEEGLPLPVASETEAGVMNATTYTAVQHNSENIDSILGGAVVVEDLPEAPTQEQLTTAWQTATGKTDLINRASIYDETNKKVWYYYENAGAWKSVGSDGAQVSVSIATNDAPGIIQGSTKPGELFMNPSGTGSVVGWDGAMHDIDNLTELINGIDVPRLSDYTLSAPNLAQLLYPVATADTVVLRGGIEQQSAEEGANVALSTLLAASNTRAGVMTSADKAKLDSLDFSEMTITRVNNLPPAVVTGFEDTTYGSTELVLHLDTKDLATGGVSVQELTLTSATPTSAGVMTGAQVVKLNSYDATITELDNLVSDMLNSAVAITGLSANPTQDELTTAWKSASSEDTLINRAMIYDVTNEKTWCYFSNVATWELTSGAGGSDIQLYSAYSTATDGANTAQFINNKFNSMDVSIGVGSVVDYSASYASNRGAIAIGNGARATTGTAGGSIGIGRNAKVGSASGAIAIGDGAGSGSQFAIAIGRQATVTGGSGVAIGGQAISTNQSIAIGPSAKNTRTGEVSFSSSAATARYIANVKAGELDTDAVNVKQVRDVTGGDVLYASPNPSESIPLSSPVSQYEKIEVIGSWVMPYQTLESPLQIITFWHLNDQDTSKVFQICARDADVVNQERTEVTDTWQFANATTLSLVSSTQLTGSIASPSLESSETPYITITKVIGYKAL